jgi:hypothetical protein
VETVGGGRADQPLRGEEHDVTLLNGPVGNPDLGILTRAKRGQDLAGELLHLVFAQRTGVGWPGLDKKKLILLHGNTGDRPVAALLVCGLEVVLKDDAVSSRYCLA